MFWLSGRLHGVVRHFSPSPPLLYPSKPITSGELGDALE
jgi:hypothetical protein